MSQYSRTGIGNVSFTFSRDASALSLTPTNQAEAAYCIWAISLKEIKGPEHCGLWDQVYSEG